MMFLKILRNEVMFREGRFFMILSSLMRSFSVSLSTIRYPVNSIIIGFLVISTILLRSDLFSIW